MTYDHNQFLIDLIVKGDHHLIESLYDPSFDQLKQLVDRGLLYLFPESLQTEEICLHAVKRDVWAIRYIKNPSEQIQMAAVRQTGYAVRFIKNPSEQVQMAAVTQDGYAIQFIDNPSEAVQLAAVQQIS